jgi:DNA-binding PadR family transcriptional regulator
MSENAVAEKSLDERVIEALSTLKEGCHFNVAAELYPDLIGEAEEFRAKMDETAATLKSLEARGLAESAGDFAGVEFFRAKAPEGNPPTPEKGRVLEDVESMVLAVLKTGNMTASDVAGRLFTRNGRFRVRTSQMFVCLKRLERKGLVAKAERQGKKQYYMLSAPAEEPKTEKQSNDVSKEDKETAPEERADMETEEHDVLSDAEITTIEAVTEGKGSLRYRGVAMAAALILALSFVIYIGEERTGLSVLPGDGNTVPLAMAGAAFLLLAAAFLLSRRKGAGAKVLNSVPAGI